MDYQYGQNNNDQGNNAWNNEWSNPQMNQNPYQQPDNGNGGNNNYGGNGTGSYNGNGTGNNGTGSNGTGSNGNGGNRNHKKGGKGVMAAALVGVLLVGVAGGAFGAGAFNNNSAPAAVQSQAANESTQAAAKLQESSEASSAASSDAKTSTGTAASTSSATPMSVEQIATNCLPSIVAITNKGEEEIRSMWGTFTQQTESAGSGVIIGETDKELLIVTNYHVVQGSESLSVLFSYQEDNKNSEIAKATIKDYDANKDIAVISIDKSTLSEETLKNIKVATIGDSGTLQLGEQVVAIGNALGYGQSVTTGIISAKDRSVTLQSEDGSSTLQNKYLQTDAAINPGNSGGGLFNMYGQLVGINSAKVSSEDVEGMGYSIPISDIKDNINTMMNTETRQVVAEKDRGYLGIQGANVTSEINQSYGIPKGVYVSGVSNGSPAADAGITKGFVITGLDGKSVTTIEQLKEYLTYYKAGETVKLTVQEQGSNGYTEKTIEVKLGTQSEAGISSSSETTQQQETQDNSGSQDQGGSNGSDSQNPYSDLFNYFGQQGN